MAAFKIVPRSAVYGRYGDSEPEATGVPLRTGAGPRVQSGAMPVLHQVELLKGEIVKLRNDRQRIVNEANAKLGALVKRVRQLEGFIRTGYAPGVQVPGAGPVDVGVPTHALRNPNVYGVDGSRGAPPAQDFDPRAGNPRDAAAAPGDRAQTVDATVRQAEDMIFYGRGDEAFYEGGEND